MYEGNPGLASQVIRRFFGNIFFTVIEIDGHYIANVVFIGVNENAIALFVESMLLGPRTLVLLLLIATFPDVRQSNNT